MLVPAFLIAALLVFGAPAQAARLPEPPGIGADLPTLPPGPIDWGPEGRYPPFSPLTPLQRQNLERLGLDPEVAEGRDGADAAREAQLKAIQHELAHPDTLFPTGVGYVILRLSPPDAPPRAIVHLRDGRLYLTEQRQAARWESRPLTDFPVTMVDTYDLTGDGRPEITAARIDGSGAWLSLWIYAWDDKEVREVFRLTGAHEPGQWGFFDAEGDGRRELAIDTAAGHGLFQPLIHGPFLRDRLIYKWDGRTYRLHRRYRFATPFYHLNRYLWLAGQGEWQKAAKHAEPGAQIDRKAAAWLGAGPLLGDSTSDYTGINSRLPFSKEGQTHYADFGPTGRVLRITGPALEGPKPKPRSLHSPR